MTPETHDKLSALLDQELDSTTRDQVTTELAGNPESKQVLAELQFIKSTIRGLPRVAPSTGFATRLMARIDDLDSESRPRWTNIFTLPRLAFGGVMSAVAAAAVVLVLVFTGVLDSTPSGAVVASGNSDGLAAEPIVRDKQPTIMLSENVDVSNLRFTRIDFHNGEVIRVDSNRRKNVRELDGDAYADVLEDVINDYAVWLTQNGVTTEAELKAKLQEMVAHFDLASYVRDSKDDVAHTTP